MQSCTWVPKGTAFAVLFVCGCTSDQSALHPASREAADVAVLFWAMAAGTIVIWLIVMGAAIYAVVGRRRPRSERFADRFTLVGGVAFPVVVLAALLLFGLTLLPDWHEDDAPDLRIHVTAEQYWWRIVYELPDGTRVETANEVHLPVDATAEFRIASRDVIHSFWIPALGGKMDAIPGRTNTLRLTPMRTGVYRGVCAEFCGPSHAFMAFDVRIHGADGFARWIEMQRASAAVSPGARDFIASGCGACHTVRGVVTGGVIGPDLTHVATRATIGAGTLPNTEANLRAWLASPQATKPAAVMPPYGTLPAEDLDALVDFLMELR